MFDNTFQTVVGPLQAGTSFALALEGLPALLVTCQHLFGPAGGLSKDVPPQFMSRFVTAASVKGALGEAVEARAGAAVFIPQADAGDPARDLAAFPLQGDAARPLAAGAAAKGERVYLAARLRQGAPPGTWLFAAEHWGEDEDGTAQVRFEDPAIHMPGTSGAPVVNEAGQLVGMVVRFGAMEGITVGTLLGARTIDALLREVAWPPPPKKGLLGRLFG